MTGNPYDQASRFLVKRDPEGVFAWLLNLRAADFRFVRWEDARRLHFPGEPDRYCDTVAHLENLSAGGSPWTAVLEFQADPDPHMFGRLLAYLGQLWLELRPHAGLTDRFDVAAVVVNLSGTGNTSRRMAWPEAGLVTELKPREVNLGRLEANGMLDEVESGRVTRTALAFVPLMQNGGDPTILSRWLTVASAEPDVRRRGDLGYLAKLFAEKAGCWEEWDNVLKGWNMVISKQVQLWQAEGKAEGKAEAIVRLLLLRFKQVPEDLACRLNETTDVGQIEAWFDLAFAANSLEEFRAEAKL
jgi:hypothetical protein